MYYTLGSAATTYFFACQVGTHCTSGQKLAAVVTDAPRPSPPSPTSEEGDILSVRVSINVVAQDAGNLQKALEAIVKKKDDGGLSLYVLNVYYIIGTCTIG